MDMMQQMITDLGRAVGQFVDSQGRRYFTWKPESLEYLCAGRLRGCGDALSIVQDAATLHYERKQKIALLGDLLDVEGSTSTSFHHNLGRAKTHYFKHQAILRNKALPMGKRLQAWRDTSAAAAVNNSETWHITSGLLSDLRTWELQMLRRLLRLRRRPDETRMMYNITSAQRMQRWLEQHGVPMVYKRVLKSIFKAAWKETWFTLDGGAMPLKCAREYRNALWCQTLSCMTTSSQRRKIGLQRGQAGQQRTPWENPFLAVWGLHWRDTRSTCSSAAEWMSKYTLFLDSLSEKWNLPWLRETSETHLDSGWITVKLKTAIDDLPPFLANPRAAKWSSSQGRLWIQTDNQQVDHIFDGRSFFEPGSLRPVCVRIARSLFNLVQKGAGTRLSTTPLVEWDPREYNSLADHAANVALDLKEDWFRADWARIRRAKSTNANLRLCLDGALRGDGSSSAGLALVAYPADGSEVLLCRAGRVTGRLGSAFVAELLALEWGVDFLTRFLYLNNEQIAGSLFSNIL